jgi:hypothetical protein
MHAQQSMLPDLRARIRIFGRLQQLRISIKRNLPRFYYGWAYIPVIGDLVVKNTFKTPPVLVVSFPRSGSSWLGARLGLSSNAAYLREPINTDFLDLGGKNTLKSIRVDQPDPIFSKSSAKAFLKAPSYDTKIVAFPRQWLLWNLKGKRRLLKEVNPLALEYWIQEFSPIVIFIVRHPAAIAASYMELGWLENDDVRDTPHNSDLSPFEVFGRRVGEVFEYSLNIIKEHPQKHLVVKYEDLVLNEAFEVSRISAFAGLKLDSTQLFADLEGSSKNLKAFKINPFSLLGRSSDQNNKWRTKLSQSQIDEVRKGYLVYAKQYYLLDQDW